MDTSIDVMVWLSCGYAVFLLAVAFLVDAAARRVTAHRDSRRSGGFRYHPDHDAWRCPQDQWLWPQSFDPENRVMRYRGHPLVCNACPVKDSCTTSQTGREVTRPVDPWPSSEAARFHRGVACCVAVLAVVWPLAMALGGRSGAELAVLCLTSGGLALASLPLWSHLRRTPAGFPGTAPSHTLDELGRADREAQARERRRHPRYASDRRAGVAAEQVRGRDAGGLGGDGGVSDPEDIADRTLAWVPDESPGAIPASRRRSGGRP